MIALVGAITFSITTFITNNLIVTVSIKDAQHHDTLCVMHKQEHKHEV
jgi:hypothetical protein